MRPAAGLLLLFSGALGCANQTLLLEAPPAHPAARVRPIAAPLALEWLETRRAGVETNPTRDFVALCADSLRSAGGFAEVYEPRRAHEAPASGLRLTMRISEEFDRRPAANITKVIAIVLSAGVTGILVPFYFDERVTLEGALRAPDGAVRLQRVSVAARIRAFPLVGLASAEAELRGRVLGDGLRAFAAAIASDGAALLAGARSRDVAP
jgi:hypothetical protein